MAGAQTLDRALRAYAPSWEHVGAALKGTFSNIDQAREAAGLDWEPYVAPQFDRRIVTETSEGPVYEYFEPTDPKTGKPLYKYVKRSDTHAHLDSANQSYPLFGNGEMFEVAQAIGEAGAILGHEVSFVAGGEVSGGRRTFLMADLGVRELPGDPSPHVRYLGLVNSHDGTASLKVIGTDLRWFCTNQIKAAEMKAKQAGTAFSFRHSGDIQRRVNEAKDAIIAAIHQLDLVHEESAKLLDVKVSAAQRQAFVEEFAIRKVITKSDVRRAKQAEGSAQRAKAIGTITTNLAEILESPTCAGISDTAYGLFAASVEYLDHRRDARGGVEGVFGRTVINTEPGKILALATLHDVLQFA